MKDSYEILIMSRDFVDNILCTSILVSNGTTKISKGDIPIGFSHDAGNHGMEC